MLCDGKPVAKQGLQVVAMRNVQPPWPHIAETDPEGRFELAGLPPQAQAMVRQATQQIAAEKDPAKIKEMVGQIEQMTSQAPPEMKPALELVLKRANERLAALEGAAK